MKSLLSYKKLLTDGAMSRRFTHYFGKIWPFTLIFVAIYNLHSHAAIWNGMGILMTTMKLDGQK